MDQPDAPAQAQPDQSSALSPEVGSKPHRKNRPGAGRPRVEINWQQFDAMCFAHSTLQEIADFFQCSTDTIERAVKREFKRNFADVYREKSSRGKISLRRAQVDAALRHRDSRMLQWLGKQWLGQREVVEMDVKQSCSIPPEVEAKDTATLEREIQAFFQGLDFSRRLRRRNDRVTQLEADAARQDQARSLPEPEPGLPATQEQAPGGWPTRRDLAALKTSGFE